MTRGPIPDKPEFDAVAAHLAARVGKRIAAERRKAKLSLRGLAAEAGVSYDSIRRVEAGDHTATLRTLVRICEALKIDLVRVLGR